MILGISPFSTKEAADQFDFNGDKNVDLYDEIELRKLLIKQG